MRRIRVILLCWGLSISGGGVASGAAQETISYASLAGRVSDPQGGVVPGAIIVVRHLDTNAGAEAASDDDGRFRFPYLRIGPYEIIVRKPGFADVRRRLTLDAGAAYDLPVALDVASLDATVTVEAEAEVVEAGRSQIAGKVSTAEARTLPLNGRNFLDLALLVPGVSPTNVGGTQLFAETSGVPGVGLSVGSQRNFSNNFMVDGLSANDDAAGLSGIPLGVDAVEQLQVVTSGAQAELGRALGGHVSVVTRSGTNTRHGDVYDYVRDRRLTAPNALSGTTLPMTQQQYGGSVGGPITRDRTFYFANAEQRRLDQSGLTTVGPQNVDVINSRLQAVGYPGALVQTGVYPNPVHASYLLAKVDHQVNGADLVSLRYSLYDASSANSRGAGGLNAPSASAGLDNLDQAIAFGNTLTLSPRTVNETRAQLSRGDLRAPPTDPVGPAVSIAGVASFGTLSGSPTARANTLLQVVDNLSHQAGAHALRTGVDLLFNADTITYPRSVRGAYTFSSLANFLSGVYNNAGFTQTFGQSVVAQTSPNIGVYVQDEWRARPGLTVNAGLRYDLQFLDTITTDRDNVAPRLGFAWSPAATRRTVVRGSAGLFYDRVPLRPLANALLSAGNTTDLSQLRQLGVSLSPSQNGAPSFPAILPGVVPSVTLVNLTTMDRHLQNASSRQASLELEHRLGTGVALSVGYQYLRGDQLIMSVNQNVPACVASGSNNGCRPNPAYANNSQYSSAGHSTYHGMHLTVSQRPAGWASYRVSYTYSKSMNNVGENFFSSPIDPFDLSKDWGRSDDDQRHRLVANGSLQASDEARGGAAARLVHGFQLSGFVQYYSALPFNITSGVTTVQGTAGRPIVDGRFIPRNTGVGSDFLGVSARVSRTFPVGRGARVEALLEGFNLTNHRNVLARNTNFGAGAYPGSPSPTFGQVTAVGEPRTFQVSVRVRF